MTVSRIDALGGHMGSMQGHYIKFDDDGQWWQHPPASGTWWQKKYGKWWRQIPITNPDGSVVLRWTTCQIGCGPGEPNHQIGGDGVTSNIMQG